MTITRPDTRSAMQARNHAPACHFCGRAIPAALFAREEERFTCEACFLRQREQQDLQTEHDRAYLAEALAAALDAREQETGLHSQRVACHTQVLALRFTQDPQRLRQIYWGAAALSAHRRGGHELQLGIGREQCPAAQPGEALNNASHSTKGEPS